MFRILLKLKINLFVFFIKILLFCPFLPEQLALARVKQTEICSCLQRVKAQKKSLPFLLSLFLCKFHGHSLFGAGLFNTISFNLFLVILFFMISVSIIIGHYFKCLMSKLKTWYCPTL